MTIITTLSGNASTSDAPCFIILLCLTPDDCTLQGESAALTHWATALSLTNDE
jgi:hypothetical protein